MSTAEENKNFFFFFFFKSVQHDQSLSGVPVLSEGTRNRPRPALEGLTAFWSIQLYFKNENRRGGL